MKLLTLLLPGFLGVSHVHVAVAAETYEIDWTVPSDGQPFPKMDVLVGDTIIFNYGSDQPHDVYIHPNNLCEMPVNRIRVKGNNGPGIYTFTEPGGRLFVCDTGGHCEKGLQVRIIAYENDCERQFALGLNDGCDGNGGGSGSTGAEDGSTSGTEDGDGDGSGNDGSGSGNDGSESGNDGSGGVRATVGFVAGAVTACAASLLASS